MSQYDLVITGGTVANSTETFSADIGIRDGRIVAIAEQLEGGERTIDASGNSSSFLNLAVSDGTSAVVSRFATGDVESPSLFTLTGSECVCCDGMCRMVEQNDRQAAVLVSSEPLNDDIGWQRVAHNHLVLVRPDRSLETRPVSSPRGSVV